MVFLKWVDQLNRLIKVLLGILLGIMTILVLIQIIVRFLLPMLDLNISVPWTEELSRYSMIWLVFIGGAVAVRHSELLAVDVIITVLPPNIGKIIQSIGQALSLIFYVILLIIGIKWLSSGIIEKSPILQIPKMYLNVSLVLGACLMIINNIALFVDRWINKEIMYK